MALTATVSFFFLKVIFYFVFLSIGAIKTAESDPLPVVVSCLTYLTKYIFNVASQTAKKAWSLKIDLQYIGYTALQQTEMSAKLLCQITYSMVFSWQKICTYYILIFLIHLLHKHLWLLQQYNYHCGLNSALNFISHAHLWLIHQII